MDRGQRKWPGFYASLDCPFQRMEEELESLKITNIILVDFHVEASSEKIAMGWFLDGRASCIWYHTHVATADERILSGYSLYHRHRYDRSS